jgi:hypothetical protein
MPISANAPSSISATCEGSPPSWPQRDPSRFPGGRRFFGSIRRRKGRGAGCQCASSVSALRSLGLGRRWVRRRRRERLINSLLGVSGMHVFNWTGTPTCCCAMFSQATVFSWPGSQDARLFRENIAQSRTEVIFARNAGLVEQCHADPFLKDLLS